ncbi:hypothetical protein Mevan_0166 [Methanococcus vannielii SB]|uniref:Uncharacterized protein n=1 Tax=Methanococcus vannielii (strain ATCC 35089 / DSM 1224 / JCM 13029 / OCM 148 / SB) TaxID=406327 RepID=A6UNK5_METVS|nr:CARDB domain-containing protein [Methanococcus vannielii]ABR54077.1 hypothetical protein Mevan_0166 [Methanococcus vannielii SB]
MKRIKPMLLGTFVLLLLCSSCSAEEYTIKELGIEDNKISFLIYNESSIAKNMPVNGTYTVNIFNESIDDYITEVINFSETTDEYGVLKLEMPKIDTFDYVVINFEYPNEFKYNYFLMVPHYSANLNGYEVYAENGILNYTLPLKSVGINEHKNVTVYIGREPRTFEVKDGFLNIYIENITETIEIWGAYGADENNYPIFELSLTAHPNKRTFGEKDLILMPNHIYEKSGKNVSISVALINESTGKIFKNQVLNVEYGLPNDKTVFNVTTDEFGIATFGVLHNSKLTPVKIYYDETVYRWIYISEPYEGEENEENSEWAYLSGSGGISRPNENLEYTFLFSGSKPIKNHNVMIYGTDGYIGTVKTDEFGRARYNITYVREGTYFLTAFAVYNDTTYISEHSEPIIISNAEYDLSITGNILLISSNIEYSLYKEGIRQVLYDASKNVVNKQLILESGDYGTYTLEPWIYSKKTELNMHEGMTDHGDYIKSVYYHPFTVQTGDFSGIKTYVNYELPITVSYINGTPVNNATVISVFRLYTGNYEDENYYNGNVYHTISKTDDSGNTNVTIKTQGNSIGYIDIYVSDGNHLFLVESKDFKIAKNTEDYIDLTGTITYRALNATENEANIEVVLEIQNLGTIDAENFEVHVYLNSDLVKNETISVSRNSKKTIMFNQSIKSFDNVFLRALIDSKDQITEYNEENNEVIKRIHFPDLKVNWLSFPSSVVQGTERLLYASIEKDSYDEVQMNISVELNGELIYSKLSNLSGLNRYEWLSLPVNVSNPGSNNLTVKVLSINTIDKNISNNEKTVQFNVKGIAADISRVSGIPKNNVLASGGEYQITAFYNVSIPETYTSKIVTSNGIEVISNNETKSYVYSLRSEIFTIRAKNVSKNENISIEIYQNEKLLKKETIPLKIMDNPVVIKYSNITTTNESVTLDFQIFETTEYDIERRLDYIAMIGESGRTLNGIDYLARYPHGCIEQITSPMVASIYVKEYCNDNNIFTNVNFDNMVSSGIIKLTTEERKPRIFIDGYAWGLYGSYSEKPIHTGYVLYGLTTAKMNGHVVNNTYLDNGAKWLITKQKTDGSWESDYAYYMRDDFSSNALITISLQQVYNVTDNNEIKPEIFNATNKSVRYLISQNINNDDDIYKLGYKAWVLSNAYNMGINDSDVFNALNDTVVKLSAWADENQEKSVTYGFTGTTSYSIYGVASESVAISSIGLHNSKDIINNDAYSKLNSHLVSIYSIYGGSGWGSTKSTGYALRAITLERPEAVDNMTIDVYVNSTLIDSIILNNSNPKYVGKYINDSHLTPGSHTISFNFSKNAKIVCGGLISQTTPYSIAINSNGKDYIDPLAEDFFLDIISERAVQNREFNMTFNIRNEGSEPILVGILDIDLPEGLNYTENIKNIEHAYMANFNSTTNKTKLYVYPELIERNSILSIIIPVISTTEVSKTVEALFYPMYNEELIAPQKATISIVPLKILEINTPLGWGANIKEISGKTVITIDAVDG